jgi:hypothetical protein
MNMLRLVVAVILFSFASAWAQNPIPEIPFPSLSVAPLQITTACPVITPGVAYQCQFTATGGTPPYHWSIIGGIVPPGLTLSDSGLLSGTVYICSQAHTMNCVQQWPEKLQLIMAGKAFDIPVTPRKKVKARRT